MWRKPLNYAQAKRKQWRLYRVRCAGCKHRQTFRKHPDFYAKLPQCPWCRRREWKVDWFRTSRLEANRYTCRCGVMPADRDSNSMPHRRGSTRNFHGFKIACKHRQRRASERKAA